MKTILKHCIVLAYLTIGQALSMHAQIFDTGASTFAVIVGISDYQDKDIADLRFAHKDAEAFANYLRSPAGGSLDGDHLKVLLNDQATSGRIAEALDGLIEQAKEGDRVIIYFSGHGDVERKTITQPGFLLCWDAPSRVYMGGGTYSLSFLQEIVTTLTSQNLAKVVVITDACHAGKLSGNQIGGPQLTSANLAKQYANEVKILACQPHEFSLEGEQWGGGRGCFSYHLVDGLFGLADRNGDGSVTVGELDNYLEEKVTPEATPESQMPILQGNKNERLATVNLEILEGLKKAKSTEMVAFAATETRGFEDDVLEKVDNKIRETYRAFKKAVQEKRFFEPAGNCAEDFFAQLIEVEALSPLWGTMKRNYAAALQDEAQQTLNEWLKTSDEEALSASSNKKRLPQKVFTEKAKLFPRCLDRAAEILGSKHYMYSALKARKYFFEGYLLANSNRNPNAELGGRALSLFRQSLQWQPEQPHVYWQMSGVFGLNLQNPDSLVHYAQLAFEAHPTWAKPFARAAFILTEKYRQLDRAKPFLEMASRIDSNNMQVLNTWGVYYLRRKNYMLAEAAFEKAIQIDSTFTIAYNSLGAVYENTQRYDEAEAAFKRAIHFDTTLAQAYSNLGAVYFHNRRIDEAVSEFKKAIQIDSTNDITHYNLGSVYAYANRYEEAEAAFKKAIELDSTIAQFHNNLGVVYRITKRFDKAEAAFKKTIQLDSKFDWAYYNLACLYSLQNNLDTAFEILKQAIEYGSYNYTMLQEEKDFDNMRASTKWKPLMKKYFPDQIKD